MKNWFSSLDKREQKFVLAAAVFLVFAVLYLGLWLPLAKGQDSTSTSVGMWQAAVQQIKQLNAGIGNTTATQISPSNLSRPLVVVVDSTLRFRKLNSALKRSQPTGNDIRVEFENVAFDELIIWLGDLSNQYALQVQSGSFSIAGGTSGRVNAQLTLGR